MQEISSVFSNGNRKFIPPGASCRPRKFKWKNKRREISSILVEKGSIQFRVTAGDMFSCIFLASTQQCV